MMKKTKSAYCEHYLECDREENCKDGDFCPFFIYNPAFQTCEKEPDKFRSEMDDVWEGREEK